MSLPHRELSERSAAIGAVQPDKTGKSESAPTVAFTRAELSTALAGHSTPRATVAFVPTMGALHDGHAALFDVARQRADCVVSSIFVNPLQFGPNEDLSRYPRALANDLAVCAAHGVDIVFTPDVHQMYPDGEPAVRVEPGKLGEILEGAVRPGHFRGVLAVVAKLINMVRPDVVMFGEKDYQQLVLIRRMVHDLCLPVEVVGVPTVREADGLALSSRNRFLSPSQRSAALALSRALRNGRAAHAAGPAGVLAAAEQVLAAEPAVQVDYLALRSTDLSEDASTGAARLLVAAEVGTTRLIDNVAVDLGDAVD